MTTPETFVRHFRLDNGAQVVVVVRRADLAALAAASCSALVDELPSHQRIYFADHSALAHAERPRDGVRARSALAFLPRTGNQVGVDLELVGIQAQKKNVVVNFEVGHGLFKVFHHYSFRFVIVETNEPKDFCVSVPD
jgi:hypothetical protein